MCIESRRATRTCHGVPLVANSTGVENEGKLLVDSRSRSGRSRGYQPRLAVRVLKASVLKQALRTAVSAPRYRPLHRLEILILLRRETRETANIESAPSSIVKRRQSRVLIEYLRRRAVIELLCEAHPLRYLRND